ncbi:hypothetical protein BJY01DRAFT_217930 [Aspergillus pseudoustus]|uniref:Zn(2)-C6 fungal-type domain-containing protein n=1 Tax=Aspergillus pseudoustus TaxID=1810923 RepID=A0ABR4JPW3_9EURO
MKRIIETSRSGSAYARKRAVTACQVCRARRTKCDQKKPRCSFCESTGAECVSEPAGLSSFDPASIAILERLDGLDRKLDSIQREKITAETQTPANPSPVSNQDAISPTQIPLAENLLPGRLEAVLAWPIFQGSAFPLPTDRELLTPGPRLPIAPQPILGDELNASATQEYLHIFFNHVHIKNPVLEEGYTRRLVRRISIEGPGWDAESCLALLICANGAIARPFGSASLSSEELRSSTGCALFGAAQKRMGIILDSATIVEAQCLFFAGVYLMTCLRPYDAWRSFLQGLSICQNFEFIRQKSTTQAVADAGTTAEESIYWSCWKSERELRLELGLPDFGAASSALTAPQRFPSLPFTDDDRMLRAWYFYLSEISLWRLEMEARTEITSCLSSRRHHRAQDTPDRLWDLLSDVGHIYSQQSVAWQDSLPPMVRISESTGGQGETDILRFILRGRKTYFNELITWPFIVHAVTQSDITPGSREWVLKGVDAHLERLKINSPGFYHRHHGTWLMIRSSARSVCILFAIARACGVGLFPVRWKKSVQDTVDMLHFWAPEVAGLEPVVILCQNWLSNL